MDKIAVIGSGISGLSCAYLLKNHYDVTLFEKNIKPGGHSNTINIQASGVTIPVDTGFIVFNKTTYPHLCSFFEQVGVDSHKSDMSFGVSIDEGRIQYCGSSLNQFFSQRKNIFSPTFLKMGLDIIKFNKKCSSLDTSKIGRISLDQFISDFDFSRPFLDHYLYPIAGCIWSMPVEKIGSFPAANFIKFFQNHGLLSISDHPQWYTVEGGSHTYVNKVIQALGEDHVRLNDSVIGVKKQDQKVAVTTSKGYTELFEKVVIASPAPAALKMLSEPTALQSKILGSFSYSKNRVVVHSDVSFMPKKRLAWASWVYMKSSEGNGQGISLTYWMNNLQNLKTSRPVFVTLNPHSQPDPNLTYDEIPYDHPVFDEAAIRTQQDLPKLNHNSSILFCGSYHSYGFHEDGIASALRVVNNLGVRAPWQ